MTSPLIQALVFGKANLLADPDLPAPTLRALIARGKTAFTGSVPELMGHAVPRPDSGLANAN